MHGAIVFVWQGILSMSPYEKSYAMSFYWDSNEVTVLFKELHITSWWGLLLVAACFVILGCSHELLRCYRVHLADTNAKQRASTGASTKRPGPCNVNHVVQTVLHVVELCSSFALMLMVMTYNVWILIAVVTGATIGHQMCRHIYPAGSYLRMMLGHSDVYSKQGDMDDKDELVSDNEAELWMRREHNGAGSRSKRDNNDSSDPTENKQLVASF